MAEIIKVFFLNGEMKDENPESNKLDGSEIKYMNRTIVYQAIIEAVSEQISIMSGIKSCTMFLENKTKATSVGNDIVGRKITFDFDF